MTFFNILLISGLLLLGRAPERLSGQAVECSNLEISYKVVSAQTEQFTLQISPAGGKAPYKIVLSEESGHLVTEDFTKSRFENLKKGKYVCLVVDRDRCLKKTEIQIQ